MCVLSECREEREIGRRVARRAAGAHRWEVIMMLKAGFAGLAPTVRGAWRLAAVTLFFASAFAPIESARAGSCSTHGADNVLTAPCGVPAPVSAATRPVVVAQAGGVPDLEFAQGCHVGARGDANFLATCMRDEQQARQKLSTEWETFPHADRTQCTALARLGGGGLQSYVELITCLEMAKAARALPKSAKE